MTLPGGCRATSHSGSLGANQSPHSSLNQDPLLPPPAPPKMYSPSAASDQVNCVAPTRTGRRAARGDLLPGVALRDSESWRHAGWQVGLLCLGKKLVRWPKSFSPCYSQTLEAGRAFNQNNPFDQPVIVLKLKADSSFTGPLLEGGVLRLSGSLSWLAALANASA